MTLALWRAGVWLLALTPLAWLGWLTTHAGLGANPVEFIEHYTGLWTLRLLLATLAMTPLRHITGRIEPIQVRRPLGLWAYAWLWLHFSSYLVFDLAFSPAQLIDDIIKRSYITVGFAALLLLTPLAITSTRGWQRRLKRGWARLHRLIYPAALLGTLHFLWLVKADHREPLAYLAIALGLLAFRVPWQRLRAQPAPA
jgi:sulfoxide reductase heme-binding subunit YedZ